jgi:hypothetical protein
MSEETQEVSELAETPAPEQAATAAPESENITPEEKSTELVCRCTGDAQG